MDGGNPSPGFILYLNWKRNELKRTFEVINLTDFQESLIIPTVKSVWNSMKEEMRASWEIYAIGALKASVIDPDPNSSPGFLVWSNIDCSEREADIENLGHAAAIEKDREFWRNELPDYLKGFFEDLAVAIKQDINGKPTGDKNNNVSVTADEVEEDSSYQSL